MSFETAGYQLLPVLPELVLAVGAMVLLMIGAYRGTQTTSLVTGLAICLLVLTGVAICWSYELLPRWLLAILVAREASILHEQVISAVRLEPIGSGGLDCR